MKKSLKKFGKATLGFTGIGATLGAGTSVIEKIGGDVKPLQTASDLVPIASPIVFGGIAIDMVKKFPKIKNARPRI